MHSSSRTPSSLLSRATLLSVSPPRPRLRRRSHRALRSHKSHLLPPQRRQSQLHQKQKPRRLPRPPLPRPNLRSTETRARPSTRRHRRLMLQRKLSLPRQRQRKSQRTVMLHLRQTVQLPASLIRRIEDRLCYRDSTAFRWRGCNEKGALPSFAFIVFLISCVHSTCVDGIQA